MYLCDGSAETTVCGQSPAQTSSSLQALRLQAAAFQVPSKSPQFVVASRISRSLEEIWRWASGFFSL